MHLCEDLHPVASTAPEPWPTIDPDLLDERPDAPPAFPLDVLPPFWRRWTEDATASAGAPADYVALSLMTAAASLIPDRWIMPSPGWAEPCVLWTALVGPSACGKTPAVEAACRLLGGVWFQRRSAPPAADGPASSAPPFTSGTTIEAVLEALRPADRRGLLLVRDEAGGWLTHMARGTHDGSAHAFWLSTWGRRNLDFGRRGRTVMLERPSLSILGTAHPEALAPALSRDDGGVLARFLFVRPAATASCDPLTHADAIAPEAVAALQRLDALPCAIRDLWLTDAALAAFDRFRRAHRVPMADLAGKAAAWWGKGPSQVLRLAAVLTFLDWTAQRAGTAEPDQVPAGAIAAAVRLWRDYLWPHAQATFRIAGAGGERHSRVRQVLRWLRAQRLPEVSREQIRREALSQAVDAAGAERLIEDLVEAGCLRPVASAPGMRGRRRRRWHVHPELWQSTDGTMHGHAGDGPDRAAPAALMACIAEEERRWIPRQAEDVDAVRPVAGDADVRHRHRADAEDDRGVPRDAISAIPASNAERATTAASPPPAAGRALRCGSPEGLSAICASKFGIDAAAVPPITGPAVTAAPEVTAVAADDDTPLHLNARARRRWRRLEKFAHSRKPAEPARRDAAAPGADDGGRAVPRDGGGVVPFSSACAAGPGA